MNGLSPFSKGRYFSKGKRSSKAAIVLITVFAFIFSLVPLASAGEKQGSFAPVNPFFTEFVDNDGFKNSSQGEFYGLIPPVMDTSYLKDVESKTPAKGKSYPSSYDLRDYGYVTPVKDQGSHGTCWTFASMASEESNILKSGGGTQDFSESYLANYHGFVWDVEKGGNAYMSSAVFARWDGPVSESDEPYYTPKKSYDPNYDPVVHVQSVYNLPTNQNDVKYALQNYGAVYTSLQWLSQYGDDSAGNYYNPSYTGTGYGHAVTIVGWDDNYSKSKFKNTPSGNGAYIIKNSWGTKYGNSGYYYVSYYDKCIGDFWVFRPGESTSNYDRIYSYDPCGMVNSYGYSNNHGYFASIFTAQGSENIEAAGFFAPAPGTYTVKVYKNVSSGNPTSGILAATKSGTAAYGGYLTVDMSSVPVTAGDKFSVVVDLTTPGYNYPIPVEYTLSGYSTCTASSGQSYTSSNGSTWTDTYTANSSMNVCVKAFGDSGGGGDVAVTGVELTPATAEVGVGDYTSLTATVKPASASNKNVTWSSSNTSVATVSGGTVHGVSEGSATITVTTVDGSYKDTCKVTVTEGGGETGDPYIDIYDKTNGVDIADGDTVEMAVKEKIAFTTAVYDQNGDVVSKPKLKYTSSNTKACKVAKGKLTAGKTAGTATITITDSKTGASITFDVEVGGGSSSNSVVGTWDYYEAFYSDDGYYEDFEAELIFHENGDIEFPDYSSLSGSYSLSGSNIRITQYGTWGSNGKKYTETCTGTVDGENMSGTLTYDNGYYGEWEATKISSSTTSEKSGSDKPAKQGQD